LPYCISCCAQPWRIYKHAICDHLRVVERFNLFFLTAGTEAAVEAGGGEGRSRVLTLAYSR
jgi:hypothetical protein